MSASSWALRPVADLDAARAGWSELAVAAGDPFATWEWSHAWWEVYGGGRELAVRQVVGPGGRLLAVLPLYRARRGPVTLLRFLGSGPADQQGPVAAPADHGPAGAALRAFAAGLGPRELLLAERLPRETGWPGALGGRALREESTPLIDAGGLDWEGWLATKSANFRSQVRGRERRLLRDHALAFRRTEDAARLDADLELLFALHEARWAGHTPGSQAFSPDRRDFHRRFARAAHARGWLRLWFAEVDGRAVAAIYNLRLGDSEWFYQSGRDPAAERLRVGFVLLAHTIRDALSGGVRRYRFGLGDEPYKDRFAGGDPGLVTVVAGAGPLPAVAAGAAAVVRRLPAGARGRVLRQSQR